MAELVQLDEASGIVGKSEITLRRLIKSGKIPFEKKRSMTGFVYVIDPDEVKKYYHEKIGGQYDEKGEPIYEENDSNITVNKPNGSSSSSSGRVRVAVAGDDGDASAYWQKKAENYEEKYYNELTDNSKIREELGVWRGRAEHAQAMLIKLLPAPDQASKHEPIEATSSTSKDNDSLGVIIMAGSIIILVGIVGAVLYMVLK